VFIAQREDALSFAPFKEIDPDFTEILETVHRQGVEVHAYRCRVSLEEIRILEEVPIENNFLP
jgi:sugar fermentation stimulation protein A